MLIRHGMLLTRRLIALLVLVSLGVFTGETMLADSCDDDTSSQVTGIASSQPAEDGVPHGSAHVCHCVHAHALLNTVAAAPHTALLVPQRATREAIGLPHSSRPEPQLRPPAV